MKYHHLFGFLFTQKRIKLLRKIKAKNSQGFNRISWDLKADAQYLIQIKT